MVAGMILGSVLILTSVVGLWWTDLGMRWTFEEIHEDGVGSHVAILKPGHPVQTDLDMSDLARYNHTVMLFTTAGGALFLLGLVVVVISLAGYLRFRASSRLL